MPRGTFQDHYCPRPCGQALSTRASTGDRPSNPSREFWFSLLGGHCSSALGLGACPILCVSAKTGVSVFLQSCGSPIIKSCWAAQTIPWGVSVSLLDPQAGKSGVGFRTFTTVVELLWYYCSPVCGSPTQRVWGLIFIVIVPLLPTFCGFFVFGCGVSFFWWVPASSC